MQLKKSLIVSLSLVAILSASCGSDDEESTKGTVKLQMVNSAVSSLVQKALSRTTCPTGFNCVTPDKFEMKIQAAYVVEDIDENMDNVGQVGMVWLNPDCETINDCAPSKIDFSDLTDPTAFNTRLNSQALPITTGTYRYVKIDFCVGSADVDNVRVENDSVTSTFKYGGCGVTSAELASPVELEEGDSLTINVEYDLGVGTVYWVNGSTTCGSTTELCLGGIDLVPSIAL